MSAVDKAEKLVNNYRVMLMQTDTDAGEEILCTSIAKECALIAVDEIISIGWNLPHYDNNTGVKYWNEVKIEIIKL
jgi:hypothetical protein